MLWSPWTRGFVKQLPGATLRKEVVSELEAWKPRHNVVGWPAPGVKKTEQHLVTVVSHSGFRCSNISETSDDHCPHLFLPGRRNLSHYATWSVVQGLAHIGITWSLLEMQTLEHYPRTEQEAQVVHMPCQVWLKSSGFHPKPNNLHQVFFLVFCGK